MSGGCPEPNGYEGACPQFGTEPAELSGRPGSVATPEPRTG